MYALEVLFYAELEDWSSCAAADRTLIELSRGDRSARYAARNQVKAIFGPSEAAIDFEAG
jgi:hypothetical protein